MQTAMPQQGGYVKPILLPDIIIGVLFAVGITYTDSIPLKFQKAADSFLGRVAMFIVILGLSVSGKWIIGLLAAIFALRLMRYDATLGVTEGFISTFGGDYPSFKLAQHEGFISTFGGDYPSFKLAQHEGFLNQNENFTGEQIITKVEKDGNKWFVEDVLEEKPKKIEEKIIETQAVQ